MYKKMYKKEHAYVSSELFNDKESFEKLLR